MTHAVPSTPVPKLPLPSGELVPILGQGTWNMGDDARRRREEAAALRLGLDLGMTLIDTAEMYANGGAEEVVAEAMAGRRDEVFLGHDRDTRQNRTQGWKRIPDECR